MYVGMCVGSMCQCDHAWRAVADIWVNIWCLRLLLYILMFELGSLIEPGVLKCG